MGLPPSLADASHEIVTDVVVMSVSISSCGGLGTETAPVVN
jgi:hypothetical protein